MATPVIIKKLSGRVDNSSDPLTSVNIALTPDHAGECGRTGPGNHGAQLQPRIFGGLCQALSSGCGADGRRRQGPTWQQQVLAKGWGYAVIIPTSFQADKGDGLEGGIIGLVNKGQPRKLDDWGALRAWAWGASRALDYFETDKSVDAKHVGIEGHSRYGKRP